MNWDNSSNLSGIDLSFHDNMSWLDNDSFPGVNLSLDLPYLTLGDWDVNGSSLLTSNWTGNETIVYAFCSVWAHAHTPLYQAANLFLGAAFLIPHSFRQSSLTMRSVLVLAFFLALLAAGAACAVDGLLWNAAFVAANIAHAITSALSLLPQRMRPELLDLYTKLFLPLRVSKAIFSELTRNAEAEFLSPGEIYAEEGRTRAGEGLSILLRGQMRVSCERTHLHLINSNQFLDSCEWEARESDDLEAPVKFQVSISAVEPCVYLHWTRSRLLPLLSARPQLNAILHNLIGRDITQKLYSLNESLAPPSPKVALGKPSRLLKVEILYYRSLSVDAVNTGTHGRVRSQFWKRKLTENRRSSAGSVLMTRSNPSLAPPSSKESPQKKHYCGAKEVTFETSL